MIAKIKRSSYRVRSTPQLILFFLLLRATGQYAQAFFRLLRIVTKISIFCIRILSILLIGGLCWFSFLCIVVLLSLIYDE